MNLKIITNNPQIIEKGYTNTEVIDGTTLSVLIAAKDEILKGHKLVSHPLTSSIRPDVSPYKTILLNAKSNEVDQESLKIINHAIEYTKELLNNNTNPYNWDKTSLEDFQFVDKDIIDRYIEK